MEAERIFFLFLFQFVFIAAGLGPPADVSAGLHWLLSTLVGAAGTLLGFYTNPWERLLLLCQFDRLWSEMPVNAKGRLKYLDFLNMFSSERGATPPAPGSSTKAQKGSSVPEVSERSRSAASSTPAPDLKAGLKPQSHPCVSPRLAAPLRPGSPDPQTPVVLSGR